MTLHRIILFLLASALPSSGCEKTLKQKIFTEEYSLADLHAKISASCSDSLKKSNSYTLPICQKRQCNSRTSVGVVFTKNLVNNPEADHSKLAAARAFWLLAYNLHREGHWRLATECASQGLAQLGKSYEAARASDLDGYGYAQSEIETRLKLNNDEAITRDDSGSLISLLYIRNRWYAFHFAKEFTEEHWEIFKKNNNSLEKIMYIYSVPGAITRYEIEPAENFPLYNDFFTLSVQGNRTNQDDINIKHCLADSKKMNTFLDCMKTYGYIALAWREAFSD